MSALFCVQRLQTLTIVLCALGLFYGCTNRSWAPVEDRKRASLQRESEAPNSYRVVRGDTLYAIAWRFSLNPKDVAAWNQLEFPDRIFAGQYLRLKPPSAIASSASASQAAPTTSKRIQARPAQSAKYSEPRSQGGSSLWIWPTQGKVVRGYQPDTPGGKGIEISGQPGQPVRAASLGQVVYSGSGLPGYGRIIIVKHSDSLLSAYGYLGKILVKEGDKVDRGQFIAELGTSSENLVVLHFEIRQNGKPINPLRFLPADIADGKV